MPRNRLKKPRTRTYIAFNAQQISRRDISFPTRVSLVTGPCLVARIGSRDRQEVTVLGDTVNFASRLQGKASPGGVVMDEHTYRACRRPPALQCMADVRGISGTQAVYEVADDDLDAARRHVASLERDHP